MSLTWLVSGSITLFYQEHNFVMNRLISLLSLSNKGHQKMSTNVWHTRLKICSVLFLIFNIAERMSLFIHVFIGSRNSRMKLAKARRGWLCVARAPVSPACLHVTSTFQRNLNFHTSVVLLAQLEGPAWPFSSCPVGIPFDISGDPRAEWEKRMRSRLQRNIWSELGQGESRHRLWGQFPAS